MLRRVAAARITQRPAPLLSTHCSFFAATSKFLDLKKVEDAFGPANFNTFKKKMPNWEKDLAGMDKSTLYKILGREGGITPTAAMATALVEHFEAAAAAPAFVPSTFDSTGYVNRRINNKDQKSFVERDDIVKKVKNLADAAVLTTNNKPQAITVFSPRGTGKTSLLRQLALSTFRDQMECGRVLVADCETLMWPSGDYSLGGAAQVRAMIILHLVHIFGGTTVTLSSGESISFPEETFMTFDKACETSSPPTHRRSTTSFDKFVLSITSVDDAMQLWKNLTAAAFAPKTDHQPVFLFDSVEVFCGPLASAGKHSSSGAARTRFSFVMGAMPQNTTIVWIGTLDTNSSAIPTDASFFVTAPLGGLAALSLDGARRMRTHWKSALDDEAVAMVWVATCGVPRLLEFAFDAKVSPWSASEALGVVKWKASSAYKSAAECTKQLSDADLTNVVLSCCVAWKTSEGQMDGASGRDVLVPGCSATTWEQLRFNALVFPAADPLRSVIPRYFFKDRIAAMNACCPPGVEMDFLYPDFEAILSSKRGATAAGIRWEQLIACAFAARFRVHCLAKNLSLSSYIRLAELYPSPDQHVQAVLAPYDVCLEGGVEYPASEVFADAPTANNAVIANTETAGAHHDILLPVTRRSDGEKLFIAIQCRYGNKKDAGDLEKQRFVMKGSTTEVEVLLQCCSSVEGKQTFKAVKNSTGKPVPGYKEFQEKNKYACINGEAISMTGNLLQVF